MSRCQTSYLVGNTKGRDHFYWPIRNVEDVITDLSLDTPFDPTQVEFSQFFPAGFDDLFAVMNWAWRVKKWSLEGTLSYSFPYMDSTLVMNITFADGDVTMTSRRASPADTPWAGPIEIINERELLGRQADESDYSHPLDPRPLSKIYGLRNFGFYAEKHGAIAPTFSGLDEITGSGLSVQGEMFGEQFMSQFALDYPYLVFDPDTKNLYPQFFLELALSVFTNTPPSAGPVTIHVRSGQRQPGDTTSFDVPLTVDTGIDGGTLEIPMLCWGVLHSFPDLIIDGATVSSALTLKAVEWWPYADKAGNPVYNTTTGERL